MNPPGRMLRLIPPLGQQLKPRMIQRNRLKMMEMPGMSWKQTPILVQPSLTRLRC